MERRRTNSCHDGRRRPRWVRVSQKTHHESRPRFSYGTIWVQGLSVCVSTLTAIHFACFFASPTCQAAGGSLLVAAEEEASGDPVVTRMELNRSDGRPQFVRRAVPAGRGVIVSESLELPLPNGNYQFRFVRGPEYRIITGNFTLEQTSKDEKTVRLPRMVDMRSEGWLSGDLAVPPATSDLTLRMIADDLHVAAVINEPGADSMPQAIPKNLGAYQPLWTSMNAIASADEAVVFYGDADAADSAMPDSSPLITAAAIEKAAIENQVNIAIANPFAWELPVWMATESIDGLFVLGDWLRQDKRVESIADGRPPRMIGFDGPRGLGRYAEFVYWNLLEAGFHLAPLAGTSTQKGQAAQTPIGYNRIYATTNRHTNNRSASDESASDESASDESASDESASDESQVSTPVSQEAFMDAVWLGQSMITNGPMLRPLLGGYPPGHRFVGSAGERLQVTMELKLAVRDPVDYLEIVHNGKVFHSARLDEFAAAGGQLPELEIEESGWVVVRVVTQHEDHFRMATSAPWYFEFDGRPRISRKAVSFFGDWLSDCEARLKKLPKDELAKHVPSVTKARKFWAQRLTNSTAD